MWAPEIPCNTGNVSTEFFWKPATRIVKFFFFNFQIKQLQILWIPWSLGVFLKNSTVNPWVWMGIGHEVSTALQELEAAQVGSQDPGWTVWRKVGTPTWVPSGKHTKSYGKWPIEIDGLPIKNGGSFQFVMLVYQRVPPLQRWGFFHTSRKLQKFLIRQCFALNTA